MRRKTQTQHRELTGQPARDPSPDSQLCSHDLCDFWLLLHFSELSFLICEMQACIVNLYNLRTMPDNLCEVTETTGARVEEIEMRKSIIVFLTFTP